MKLDKRNYVVGELLRLTLGDCNAAAPVRVQVSSSATGDQETLTLTPDPVFVKFYYSHPPASERLARMAAA